MRKYLRMWFLAVVAVCAVQASVVGDSAAVMATATAPSEVAMDETSGKVEGDVASAPGDGDVTQVAVKGNVTVLMEGVTQAPVGGVTAVPVEGNVPAPVKGDVTVSVEEDDIPVRVERDATPSPVERGIVLMEQTTSPKSNDALLEELLPELGRYCESILRASETSALTQVTARLDALQGNVIRLSDQLETAVSILTSQQEAAVSRITSKQEAAQDVASRLASRQEITQETVTGVTTQLNTTREELNEVSSQQVVLQQKQTAAATHREAFSERVQDLEDVAYHITKLGFPCRNDSDCKGVSELAVCTNFTCSCPEDYSSHDNADCRPEKLGLQCGSDSSCQGVSELAVCTNHTCSCPEDYSNHDNADCWPEKLGLQCGSDSSCEAGIMAPRSVMAAGQVCSHSQDCAFGSCQNGRCPCEVRHGDYEYRLSSCGTNGIVQLRRAGDGQWGYVCDDGWGQDDATVICRSLGFQRGESTVSHTVHRAIFWMDDVNCAGSETSLLDCRYRGWGRENCGDGEVSGVSCF